MNGGWTQRRGCGPAAVVAAALALAGCGEREAPPPVAEVVKVVQPAPKPTGPLPADASCVTAECHARFLDARQVHQPVARKSCVECHAEDTGTHQFPLKRTGNDLCTFCHAVSGTMAVQHKTIENDGCMGCHDPHASPIKFLLKDLSIERQCARCHDIAWKQFAHEPFAKGQCTVCHSPHQSQVKGLLRAPDAYGLCLGCHQGVEERMAEGVSFHKPMLESCLNCHVPHTSENKAHTRLPTRELCESCHAEQKFSPEHEHGAVAQGGSCANCHDAHASYDDYLLLDREDRLCVTCHDKPMQTRTGRTIASVLPMLSRPFLHGPIRAGNCGACHAPHGSEHELLLEEPLPVRFYAPFDLKNYALCFRCHDRQLVLAEETGTITNFRDGSRNLHFVHVNHHEKGRTCKTCHEVHSSALPNHIAQTVPFEGSRWAMPIRFEKTDTGGSCAPGCHDEKAYERTLTTIETREPEPRKARGEP